MNSDERINKPCLSVVVVLAIFEFTKTMGLREICMQQICRIITKNDVEDAIRKIGYYLGSFSTIPYAERKEKIKFVTESIRTALLS
jgi:hypothetical protein